MRMIQTLWTRPGQNAGWLRREFHFMSWALSCLQLRKFYSEVELYTDTLGKHLLIDTFGLPYTKVHVVLDDFHYPDFLWAAPKIFSYGLQVSPFLHVDGDVFIFEDFGEAVSHKEFVCQNVEIECNDGGNGFYTRVFRNFLKVQDSSQLPNWVRTANLDAIEAVNAGVFGGSNFSFFQKFSQEAFAFFNEYASDIRRLDNPSYANHIAEQVLPYHMSKKMGVPLTSLLSPNKYMTLALIGNMSALEGIEEIFNRPEEFRIGKGEIPYPYMILNHYGISPLGRKYVHLIGGSKKNFALCRMMANRLRNDYPDHYNRIQSYCSGRLHTNSVQILNNSQEITRRVNFGDLEYTVRAQPPAIENCFKRTIALYKILTGKDLEVKGGL